MKVASILFFVAVLTFGQATPKKQTASTTKKAGASVSTSDTWQRSKECSIQAEKFVAEWPRRTGATPEDWSNHYSQKYEKCFVSLNFTNLSKDEKSFPSIYSTSLFDAFERSSPLATFCTLVTGSGDCSKQIEKTMLEMQLSSISKAANGKAFSEANAVEQEYVRSAVSEIHTPIVWCKIGEQSVDCAKVAAFVTEHMKN